MRIEFQCRLYANVNSPQECQCKSRLPRGNLKCVLDRQQADLGLDGGHHRCGVDQGLPFLD